ncbi:MAG: FAD-dependent oxidoreductase [Hyphomicrobiales bacterium]
MRIAIVGSGISGNAAAWALTQPFGNEQVSEVVVYERRDRIGGHSCTVDIDYDGTPMKVDVGFIVYNERNYPNLVALFDHLGVETIESDMSFGVSMKDGAFEWSGQSLSTVFAQRKNIFSLSFWTMIKDILRFNKQAPLDLKNGTLEGRSMRQYLKKHNFSKAFKDKYLAPMGAAIWSTPHASVLDFPATTFIQFFDNHRLMHKKSERPKWRTVVHGSQSYVSKIIAPFQQNIRLNSEVVNVVRRNGQVHVSDQNGNEDIFDHIIFAGHTDQTLKALDDASPKEKAILGAVHYRDNEVYLHRDQSLMPQRRSVWSAWNYIETPDETQDKTGVCVSYYANRLQNIDETNPVFVSLNPATPPRAELTFAKHQFAHPQFDNDALAAQQALGEIQGVNNTWFCGAWCGYGFHEDGLRSGLEVAEKLGAIIPWRSASKQPPSKLEAAE